MKKNIKNIGIDVKAPSKKCDDVNCPFHGNIKLRGRSFTGIVTSTNMTKTATVEWTYKLFIPKYERHETRRSKIHVHNSPCIDAQVGDVVKIMETRPLSKTKNFVIIQKLRTERGFKEELEELEEEKAKVIETKTREEKKEVEDKEKVEEIKQEEVEEKKEEEKSE
jgi:small subunit ribosomal protein S17